MMFVFTEFVKKDQQREFFEFLYIKSILFIHINFYIYIYCFFFFFLLHLSSLARHLFIDILDMRTPYKFDQI